MTERPDGQDDPQQRTLALAKAIRAEIEAYNQQHPTTPFPIDDAVSRIIANDPDYIPPRKRRANRKRPPTENPGIFTVQKIAGDLGTTVGTLLREKGFEITNSDLRTFRWIHDFLGMRFVAGSAPEIALPDESGFRVKDFTFPRQLATTKITRAGELAAGPVGRESEFEMIEAEFAGSLKGPD